MKTSKTKKVRRNAKLYCISLMMCVLAINVKAQVTIGSGIAPEGGAILELKEFDAGSKNETANKGMICPRVELKDIYKNELHPMYDITLPAYTANKTALKKSHTGLIVYNVTSGSVFMPGFYFWNGQEWRKMDDSPAVEPSISELRCTNATTSTSSYTAGQPFETIVKIPYLGGNGATYEGNAPVGGTSATNNLYIERISGKLAYGGGEVMYRVFGTPLVSSPTQTTFPISFLGKTCTVSIGGSMTSVNLKNLLTNTLINTNYLPGGDRNNAKRLNFGEIVIPETGSYAFSLRLYGFVSNEYFGRIPFYIFLHREKNGVKTLLDASEIDLVTIKGDGTGTDYSYSVTLGGVFEEGDNVVVSMHRINKDAPSWNLKMGADSGTPVRTSLIYWKL